MGSRQAPSTGLSSVAHLGETTTRELTDGGSGWGPVAWAALDRERRPALVLDHEGVVRFANHRIVSLLGWSRAVSRRALESVAFGRSTADHGHSIGWVGRWSHPG